MTDDRAEIRRNRLKLVFIFLLFFAPAVLAWVLVLTGWRPGGTVNRGELVQPPVPVAELALRDAAGAAVDEDRFRGLWSALLVVDGPCDDACLHALDRMVRVRIALNQHADRFQLRLVLPPAAPAPQLPPGGPEILRLARPAVADLTRPSANGAVPSAVHLVDPYGFRMMTYPPPLDAEGLLKDLRRLLRLSNEDVERFQRRDQGEQ